MADTQVLGTCASACGFKSHLPHNVYNKLQTKVETVVETKVASKNVASV